MTLTDDQTTKEKEPQTQAELDAYVQQSARIEIMWSAVEQHYYRAITVTLFDKRADAHREAQP